MVNDELENIEKIEHSRKRSFSIFIAYFWQLSQCAIF